MTLNPAQKSLVWLSAFCYLVLQGIVPVGYMPSFGLSSSSVPFVLCHGNDASAQLLGIQQNRLADHSQSMHAGGTASLSVSDLSSSSSNDPRSHSASFDCSFSSFYFTQILASFAAVNFTYNDFVVTADLFSPLFLTRPHLTQLRARAPPLFIFSSVIPA